MRQILTILLDSYRLLTSKKLFWVSLGLSVLIAGTYASVGFTPEGISVLFGAYVFENDLLTSEGPLAEFVYLRVFTDLLVPFWLGLGAIVLALLSVCSIFPDFLKSGSIDVAVSKPVSRVTLFLVKYLGSLLFVAIQVAVFCAIVFMAHGLRMENWNVGIFWAVPLLTFVFSLIYCSAVLTAVWTKSTLFSLLIAFLVWGVSWGVQVTESFFYKLTYTAPSMGMTVADGLQSGERSEDSAEGDWADEPSVESDGMDQFYQVIKMVEAPLPKTRDVTYLLKNKIKINGRDLTHSSGFLNEDSSDWERRDAAAKEDYENRHSEAYILGSSLIFELCVLGLACWLFVRKDY